MKKLLAFVLLLPAVFVYADQQVANDYTPKNSTKHFTLKHSPVVAVDEAHQNFHTLDGRFAPFAKVLRSDGYRVVKHSVKFSQESLKDINILVVANALSLKDKANPDLPNYSVFERGEIEAVYRWVKAGGSLLLIADHMPWPKAADDLAAIFGFHFHNGYVEVLGSSEQYFELNDKSLAVHEIVKGNKPNHSISKVRGFMGQGFLAPPEAKAVMVFTKPSVTWMPSKLFQIDDDTPQISATGWLQGATLSFGKGRVAVFGEAGMFTAQTDSDETGSWAMGMNAKGAEQNERFLLNVMLWLAQEI